MPLYRKGGEKAPAKETIMEPLEVPEFEFVGPYEGGRVFKTDDAALLYLVREGLGSMRTAAHCCRLQHKNADAAKFERIIKEGEEAIARKRWGLE